MILQKHIPYDPLVSRPLPGISPLDITDWLLVDDAYAAQMALRRQLLSECRKDVFHSSDVAEEAILELRDFVLDHLPDGFEKSGLHVSCPDGHQVDLAEDPLAGLGMVLQEDLCILQKPDGVPEHVLTAAVLCFPASWMLAEKAGKALIGIHTPVDPYDDNVAKRVQRLFDGIRPDRPLWRYNALFYKDPSLFQPRSETAPRDKSDPAAAGFLRSERQCLVRLPKTNAVVFSIHTYVMDRAQFGV